MINLEKLREVLISVDKDPIEEIHPISDKRLKNEDFEKAVGLLSQKGYIASVQMHSSLEHMLMVTLDGYDYMEKLEKKLLKKEEGIND